MLKDRSETPKYWLLLVVGGVLLGILGGYAMIKPGASLAAFAMIFSIMLFLSGISESTFAVLNRKLIHNWGWLFAYGLLSMIFGMYLMNRPGLSTIMLSMMIVFVIMYRSINAIGYSFDLKDLGVGSWWLVLLLGILGVFISFYLVGYPIETGVISMIWVGAGFIVTGIYTILLGFVIKS